jgi:hypothetical protein
MSDVSDEVDPVEAEVVAQAPRVGGHVEQGVRRLDGVALQQPDDRAGRVDVGVDLGREPDVAVVEAHDEEAPVGEALAELGVPPDQLGAETSHEDERRVLGLAEGLVLELDAVGRCAHGRHVHRHPARGQAGDTVPS